MVQFSKNSNEETEYIHFFTLTSSNVISGHVVGDEYFYKIKTILIKRI